MSVLQGLEPSRVFYYFEELCKIPHGSGDTKRISDYCVEFAVSHGFSYYQDGLNNVIIRKPASKGYENHDTVILQGHLDMVCEKDADCDLDFSKDGLRLYIDGDYVSARGTTLGGDDGIAVAMALAVLEDNTLPHPALEVLFTTDEETGMYGADGLDASQLSGKILINADSENEGVLTVGCAGGARAQIKLPVAFSDKRICKKIIISGLRGGHSGVEIDKGRHNANRLMAELLSKTDNFCLASINGGAKDNAIPNRCECIICCDNDLKKIANAFIKEKFTQNDPDLKISIEDCGAFPVLDKAASRKIVNMLCELPNGIRKMSDDIEGLVQTSLNFGIIKTNNDVLDITFSVRSSVNGEKTELLKALKTISEKYGAEYSEKGHYPAWEYKKDSVLRGTMINCYKKLYGKEPVVELIHAGLECGLFCEKIKGLDAVSFGPDMKDIHTSREKLSVSSTKRTYEYLCEILKSL